MIRKYFVLQLSLGESLRILGSLKGPEVKKVNVFKRSFYMWYSGHTL